MLGLDRAQVERLRHIVSDQLGLSYEDDRLDQLAEAATRRIALSSAGSFEPYLERLCSPAARGDELSLLAEQLTVTETFFMRNPDQLRAFVEVIVEEQRRTSRKRLRVLSAGCASGEEPYSLAIALLEAVPDLQNWDVRIRALDVNRSMLAKAVRGRFTPWSLRATPDALKARYFRRDGREFVLDAAVRGLVDFEERNLAVDDPAFFRGATFHAIFCRNVLMYFAPQVMHRVVMRMHEGLAPGGYLFLGHAETLRGLSHAYHLCHTHSTFYYRRRDDSELLRSGVQSSRESPAFDALPRAVEASGSWVDAIERASARIRALTERTDPAPAEANGKSPAAAPVSFDRPGAAELAPVLELVKSERFADALSLLGALPSLTLDDPDAVLLNAVLLTNHGKIAEAERACEHLLALDELNAGAHYLMALCREHAGDLRDAAEHDRLAMHLDATFAMPHLHAGLLAKRAGEAPLARRLLAEALGLVDREDSSRLVLFGGGFSREALAMLCRSELAALGKAP